MERDLFNERTLRKFIGLLKEKEEEKEQTFIPVNYRCVGTCN
jgi:hypothetical protein